jgi:uncharacterized protein YegL
MKTKLLIASLFALTAGAVIGYPLTRGSAAPASAAKPVAVANASAAAISQSAAAAAHPKVEVVFVLDTTSSMSGLIQGAKENIWSIASSMAQAKPTPEVHMGLVAFRDRGDDYVTRVVDLSTDLDSMYATLMDFQAAGGGDTPESVNQALYDAVHSISWSQDPASYKVIFLVGDAPPHMDYPDDVKYPDTIKAAAARGIVVNTIQAGTDSNTTQEWRQIAMLSQGKYFQVEQSGSALAVTSPYDDKIAALSRELDDTRVFYGDADKQRELANKSAATDKLHAAGSVASRVKRAMFNASEAGEKNLLGDNELVDAVSNGHVNLATIAPEALPAPMRTMSKDEQAKVIKEKADTRSRLNEEIAELGKQRSEFIAADLKKRAGSADSLDDKIYATVKAQAADKGLHYDGAAAH